MRFIRDGDGGGGGGGGMEVGGDGEGDYIPIATLSTAWTGFATRKIFRFRRASFSQHFPTKYNCVLVFCKHGA